jgi:hypothetical protein
MAGSDDAVKKLKEECDKAYDANKGSCSHAVMAVINNVLDPQMAHRNANGLVDYMTTNWTEVVLDDGFYLANLGHVVVGGKKESGNGHVIVIYPGDKILNGGYQYYWAKGKKMLTLPGKTLYPRCMSTSIGSWPGALSKGEKTVWDPWGNDTKFAEVCFWAETNIWDKVKRPGAK